MVLKEDLPGGTVTDADEVMFTDVSDSDNEKITTATLFGVYVDTRVGTLTNKFMDDFSNFIEADGQHIEVRNSSGVTLNRGDVVYISGFSVGQNLPEVELADASSAATMPAVGIVEDTTILNNANGGVDISGRLDAIDTSAFSAGDALFVSETAGLLTNVRPLGAVFIQRIATTLRSHASLGEIEIFGAGRSNDLPNLAEGLVWVGDSDGVPEEGTLPDTWEEVFALRFNPGVGVTNYAQPSGLVVTTAETQVEVKCSRAKRLIAIQAYADLWGATVDTCTIAVRKNKAPEASSLITFLTSVNPQFISATGLSIDYAIGDTYDFQIISGATLNGTNRITQLKLIWEKI